MCIDYSCTDNQQYFAVHTYSVHMLENCLCAESSKPTFLCEQEVIKMMAMEALSSHVKAEMCVCWTVNITESPIIGTYFFALVGEPFAMSLTTVHFSLKCLYCKRAVPVQQHVLTRASNLLEEERDFNAFSRRTLVTNS